MRPHLISYSPVALASYVIMLIEPPMQLIHSFTCTFVHPLESSIHLFMLPPIHLFMLPLIYLPTEYILITHCLSTEYESIFHYHQPITYWSLTYCQLTIYWLFINFSALSPLQDKWLKMSKSHIAVVHCKAGKGRTGVMLCSYLIFAGVQPTATEALSYFATQRTENGKGVTIPSQIRYVHYFEQFLNNKCSYPFPKQELHLEKIMLHQVPLQGMPPLTVFATTENNGAKISFAEPAILSEMDAIEFQCNEKQQIMRGDINCCFFERKKKKQKVCLLCL